MAWRRFAGWMAGMALGLLGLLYGFVVVVDPWGMLPLSPPLPRVPISSNARFSFPALARDARFDSVVLGTSTARLLQPAALDPEFGARFANLAMNSATAWEQAQLLGVFLRAHAHPKVVLIDMDAAWCGAVAERLTGREFPGWMYGGNLWAGYSQMLTPYAVQEAFNQFAVMVGLKRRRYGLDGYTRFVPPDAAYDRVRVDAAFARWPATDESPAGAEAVALPGLALLEPVLAAIPAQTRVVLFFPPAHVEQQGEPGSRTAARWAACKRAVTGLAAGRGAEVLDFLFPSAITRDRSSYWDPLHFREGVAGRVAALLGGVRGEEVRRLR